MLLRGVDHRVAALTVFGQPLVAGGSVGEVVERQPLVAPPQLAQLPAGRREIGIAH
jgi:hypothetical protein